MEVEVLRYLSFQNTSYLALQYFVNYNNYAFIHIYMYYIYYIHINICNIYNV